MYKKLTKKAKILNLLTKGSNVTWNQLKTTYGLKSPRAMIDTIRRDGYVVYANKNAKGNKSRWSPMTWEQKLPSHGKTIKVFEFLGLMCIYNFI